MWLAGAQILNTCGHPGEVAASFAVPCFQYIHIITGYMLNLWELYGFNRMRNSE